MRIKELRGEKGQAAVVITLLLMFAFIALAALAIDGGHLYVVRRDLQNMADAGCLAAATELSLGGDDAAAIEKAKEYVIMNGGAEELYTPHEGSDVDLVRGIEVSGAAVRVALRKDVDTYFTMIFKRPSALVGARSHCNRMAGWGPLMPIAVRRFEATNPKSDQLDLLANKKADPRNPSLECLSTDSCFYPATSSTQTLPSRYGTMMFHGLKGEYESSRADVESTEAGNIDCDLPPQDGTYEGVCVLGVHANTNDGTENYTGWVALDIRNIVGPGSFAYATSPYYLNNATGQTATNKALSEQWFCKRGWVGDIPPMLGDQLGFLPGVSADFAPKAMLACDPPWKEGDQFIAIVFSGYVWDVPDLEVTIEPDYNEIAAPNPPPDSPETHTVEYTVTLKKPQQSPDWPAQANFTLNAWFTAPGEIAPPVFEGGNPKVTLDPWEDQESVIMSVSATEPGTVPNYVSALTVEVVETGIGLKRWASTNFGYRADSGFDTEEDFTLYAHAKEFNVVQGAKVTVILPTMAFGGFTDNSASVHVLAGGEACDALFTSSCHNETIKIPNETNKGDKVELRVRDDAPIGPHTVRLEVRPGQEPSHSVDVVVNVRPPSGGDPTRFVIVEGFADFEITYIDNNDVVAYAIGPIVPDITDSKLSLMRSSLLPW